MAGSDKSKIKLLCLSKILYEQSDEEKPLSINEIIDELNRYGINAERKSIYNDLDLLENFGLDICRVKGKNYGYFIGSREFEVPELRLLIDAVQSAKFITPKKSKELIKKIEGLTSKNNSKKLETQVFMNDRIKYDNISHYRIDRICSVNVLDKPRRSFTDLVDYKNYFNTADYSNKIYNMFSGELQKIEVRFENYLIDAVIDRFGIDVSLLKEDGESFIVHTEAVISDGLVSWLLIFGDATEVIAPKSLRDMIRDKVEGIIKLYK